MTNFVKLPTWADKEHVYAVVETPRGSRAKLEFDPKLRVFTLAKPLLVGLTYPYDWGFIPSTKAEDGDPLDVLIIHDAATYPVSFFSVNRSVFWRWRTIAHCVIGRKMSCSDVGTLSAYWLQTSYSRRS
jgi:inorganic pyrophosphatase